MRSQAGLGVLHLQCCDAPLACFLTTEAGASVDLEGQAQGDMSLTRDHAAPTFSASTGHPSHAKSLAALPSDDNDSKSWAG